MDLTTARAMKRKTQWDLKLATGINQSKISLIETGYVEPTGEEKSALAEALGFEVSEIEWVVEEALHQCQETSC